MKFNIPFIKPNFPAVDDLAKDYEAIVSSNWFTNFGPFEQEFSKSCGKFLGADIHTTTISSCTLGLEAAIEILFDKRKQKVVMPSFTFAAGAEALLRSGFTPVFIDINSISLQPDLDQAKKLLKNDSDNYAGILLCNIFGVGNRDIEQWEELAELFSVPLIIDSAAGFGSRYSPSEKLGGRGNCEVFSMHVTKPFAIGEGGLVASRDVGFIQKIRSWQNFGFESDRNVHRIGTNAKLQEVNAAIGLRQLEKFEERLLGRRHTLSEYKRLLRNNGVSFQTNDELSTVPFVSALFESYELAHRIYQNLIDAGIEARRYYTPLHKQEILSIYKDNATSLGVTEDIAERIISLPVHDNMRTGDIKIIVSVIKSSLRENLK